MSKADKPKVSSLMIFGNGNVAAYGPDGEQIPELQKLSVVQALAERAVDSGFDVDGCTVLLAGMPRLRIRQDGELVSVVLDPAGPGETRWGAVR